LFFKMMLLSFRGISVVFITGIGGYLIISGLKPNRQYMDFISKLIIRIALPCLMFYTLATKFTIEDVEFWWVYPLMAVAINLAGASLAYAYMFFDNTVKRRGEFGVLVAFQNGVFLPLAFAPVFFDSGTLPYFLNILFLYNLLSVPTFFTLAVWMVNRSGGINIRLRDFINPPIVATVLGLIFAIFGWGAYVPEIVIKPIAAMGTLATPLSMFFVGGVIVTNIPKAKAVDWRDSVKITLLKSLAFPLLVCLVVLIVRPPEYVGLLLILESVMPSALMIALIAPDDGVSHKIIAGALLLTYLISIITIPLFMGVYGALYG
jgi:malate permease and related proteins